MESNKEKLLQKAYNDYIDIILYNFPIDRIEEIVDENLKGFGSTTDEKFVNINRFRQMIRDQREQGTGINIQCEQTRIHKRISPKTDIAIFTDEFRLSMQIDNHEHVIPLRVSSVFEYENKVWKLVHIHGSQGVETEENDTWHKEEWKQKQAELEKQVQEKTTELLAKNRELEIESALERIRTRSMAMQNSEELSDLSLELVKQVQKLNIDTWFCAFNIYEDENGSVEWGSNGQGTFPMYRTPREGIFLDYYNAGQNGEKLLINEIGETDCPAHYEYLCSLPGVGTQLLKMKDAGIPFPKSQIDHVSYFKYGYIIFITYKKVPESYDIFKRFTAVFEQTYTRFLDLKKAEKQTREAEIETSLERIRAKALAMNSSKDMPGTTAVMFNELTRLGIQMERNGIVIINESPIMEVWTTPLSPKNKKDVKIVKVNLDSRIHPLLQGVHKSWKESKDYFKYELTGDEVREYYETLSKYPDYKFPVNMEYSNRHINNSFYFDEGQIFAFTTKPLSKDQKQIFHRFTKVFSSTYKRYLDLQKAEAQAREAEIEAALERIRSSSLAMHKSEELQNVVSVLFEQLQNLNFLMEGAAAFIITNIKEKQGAHFWMEDKVTKPVCFYLPYYDAPSINDIYNARAERKDFVSNIYEKEKNIWFEYAFENTDLKIVPKERKNWILKQTHLTQAIALQENSMTGVHIHYAQKLSTDEQDILKRFSKVFEQGYVRFLDLQKAEAQAREAQIEAALERVRSRSLAMHKSNELLDVVTAVFEQLQDLNIELNNASIFIISQYSLDIDVWIGLGSDHKYTQSIKIPESDSPVMAQFNKVIRNRAPYFTTTFNFEEKNILWNHLFKHSDFKYIPEARKKFILEAEAQTTAIAMRKNTGIQLIRYNSNHFSDQDGKILQRFTKVFEQAYIRFLDLQKAEAQAHEAEIQLALERVRARTMAMHKSEELAESVAYLFKQLNELDIKTYRCNLAIVNSEKEQINLWSTTNEGKVIPFASSLPLNENIHLKEMYEGWKHKKITIQKLIGKKRLEWIEYLNNYVVFKEYASENIDVERIQKEAAIFNSISFKQGFFVIHTLNELHKNKLEIIQRFAKVFEQTYTRFLDLQKAEKQAREAQIEAALERVRSRSLGMQKSEELLNVVQTLYGEFESLQVNFHVIGINLIKDTSKDLYLWFSTADGLYENIVHWPYQDIRIFNDVQKSIETGEMFETSYSKEETKEFFTEYFKLESVPQKRKTALQSIEYIDWIGSLLPNSGLFLMRYTSGKYTPEEKDIVKRFAKVFEQTYIRFLDLHKAEAQAREAEIQLALERVRAKALAMHSSDELTDVSLELRKQMGILGQEDLEVCAIHLYEEDEEYFESWGAVKAPGDNNKLFQGVAKFPKYGVEIVDEMMKHYADGDKDYILVNEGTKAIEWLNIMKKHAPEAYEMIRSTVENTPPEKIKGFWSVSDFSGGALVMVTYTPPDENSRNLLTRAASVFGLAYRRYKDLKKAEEQAREAEIEMSLERIRAKAMAMRSSSDIPDAVAIVFNELGRLGILMERCGIVIFNSPPEGELWSTLLSPENKQVIEVLGGKLNFEIHPMLAGALKSWKNKKDFYSYTLKEKEVSQYYKLLENAPDYRFPMVKNYPDRSILNTFNFNEGLIFAYSVEPLSEEELGIFLRFTKVFALTFRRYQDLIKAEEQAREAQIEAALERIRASSMAMHKSEELQNVVSEVFDQLQKLDFAVDGAAFIAINVENFKGFDFWMEDKITKPVCFRLPFYDAPSVVDIFEAKKSGKDFLSKIYGKEKNIWFDYAFEHTDLKIVPVDKKKWILNQDYLTQAIAFQKNSSLGIHIHRKKHLTENEINILKRFSKVFEQGYVRFLDLEKAEKQAHESKIQLALERVRARTMAMQKSNELKDVVQVIYKQIETLKLSDWGCNIQIFDEENKNIEIWLAESSDLQFSKSFLFRGIGHPGIQLQWDAWHNNEKIYHLNLKGNEKKSYDDFVLEHTDFKLFPDELKANIRSLNEVYFSFACMKYGCIAAISTSSSLSDEKMAIMLRFANVFEQTYTRFLDLQKAEAQAREAQIEASLERIRAWSMAMHKSEELQEVITGVFHELKQLTISMEVTMINIPEKNSNDFQLWIANEDQSYARKMHLPYFDHEINRPYKNAIKTGKKQLQLCFPKNLKDSYFEHLFKHSDLKYTPEKRKKYLMSAPGYSLSAVFNKHSHIFLLKYKEELFSKEENEVLLKFANVFEQAYTRFLDLQKAELQAWEAQVEASLERVRSQAMAMQHSDDLINSASILFDEFENLNLSVARCGIAVIDKEAKETELWTTVINKNGKKEIITGKLSLLIHPLLEQTFEHWSKQKQLSHSYILEGDDLKKYYQALANSDFPIPKETIERVSKIPRQYYYHALVETGGIYVFSITEISEKEKQVLHRFGEVFHLTYTRYEDLQKAEARALEAIKQASLDRVRGEIASMRSTDDLNRITPLIWHELNALEVPFIRCGVLIMDNEREMVQTHLSAPDGTAMGIFELPYDSEQVAKGAVKNWKQKKVYKDFWDKRKFLGFMNTLLKTGKIKNPELYTGSAPPPDSLYLNFVPFKQGMLYVGNITPLEKDALDLVKSLAESFSIAYARYEDFKNIEEAKNQIESTLDELKAAQDQLVHSEKMASLGELTAGIAHEIQNPLNFVNNFAEVSSEILQELHDEIKSGNLEEIKFITNDLNSNLEKISQHGKRASSIVKGMLEHSRSSDGEKQLTDINSLVDEYVRLAYHGMRAKDKSFNSDFKMDLDKTIPEIKVASQDISRVLLNLINNAFYAVDKQAKQKKKEYKPLVKVCTKSAKNQIEIIVSDNGPGIPEEIREKIFQPFFTTKPTGQGTGLGLSLSYDIVKAHGGKISVETEQKKGTEFIIQLPVN